MTTLHSSGEDPSADPRSDADLPQLTQSMLLVKRYQAGDQEALAELLERYQDRLRRIVRIELGSRLRSCVESLDIVQDVNLDVLGQIGDFVAHDRASLLRWLSKIVLNRVRNAHGYFTAERRDVDRLVSFDEHEHGNSPVDVERCSGPLPEELAWRNELREIFDDSVAKLPLRYRAVILHRDYYNEAWSAIAAELGYVAAASETNDPRERLRAAVHAAQECHRRAWIRLRRMVRPRLDGLG